MLVLSRHVGEQIVINGNIIVTVISFKDNRVRLGITAPSDVPVDRMEVHLKELNKENIQEGDAK